MSQYWHSTMPFIKMGVHGTPTTETGTPSQLHISFGSGYVSHRAITCYFSNCDSSLGGCFKVHMVAPNAGREGQLQLLRLSNALGGEVAWKERCCDDLRFALAALETARKLQGSAVVPASYSYLSNLQGITPLHAHHCGVHLEGRCSTAYLGQEMQFP